MGIGGVWAGGGTTHTAPQTGTGASVDPVPVSIVDPVPHVEWRWPRLAAQLVDVPIVYNGQPMTVAMPVVTLPPVPTGSSFLVERLACRTPDDGTTVALAVIVGSLHARDAVDGAANPAALVVLSDAQPIRVPANTAVNIVFYGSSPADSCLVNAQLRVETL